MWAQMACQSFTGYNTWHSDGSTLVADGIMTPLIQATAAALQMGKGAAPWSMGAVVGVILLLGDKRGRVTALQGSWPNVPAWCATLLFMVPAACNLVTPPPLSVIGSVTCKSVLEFTMHTKGPLVL